MPSMTHAFLTKNIFPSQVILQLLRAGTGPEHTSEHGCCLTVFREEGFNTALKDECADKDVLQHEKVC